MAVCRRCCFQEIRDTGVSGYQYIEVEDDLAANVLYGNSTVVHLASDQIPADAMVTEPHLSHLSVSQPVYQTLYRRLSIYLYLFRDKPYSTAMGKNSGTG